MPYDREGKKQGFFSDDINEKDDMQIERERERERPVLGVFLSGDGRGERRDEIDFSFCWVEGEQLFEHGRSE